jgi:acyl carrier protein
MIIDEIEKQFGVSFKLRDIIKMKNVGDLCNKVLEKIG